MSQPDVRHEIHTVPDLHHAISTAQTKEDRLRIFNRAHYLGLSHKLPKEWNPDGTLSGVSTS